MVRSRKSPNTTDTALEADEGELQRLALFCRNGEVTVEIRRSTSARSGDLNAYPRHRLSVFRGHNHTGVGSHLCLGENHREQHQRNR